MEKSIKWSACAAVIILIIIEVVIGIKQFKPYKPTNDTIEIVKVREKRDSILQTINDTVIITIEKAYEENRAFLFNQPTDSQCLFLSEYLSKNARRYSSNTENRASKGN